MKKTIIVSVLLILAITLLDYANIPTLLGLSVSNMNWEFYIGVLNIIAVLVVFAITFKTLSRREIKLHEKDIVRQKNKYEIALLFLQDCYDECLEYIKFLNEENVEKYIVPKIDFNSTNPIIISNLQNAPFDNEGCLMDFVKDGQIKKRHIAEYLDIKRKFRQYVNMRITIHDAPELFEPLKNELSFLLDVEIKEIKNLMQE